MDINTLNDELAALAAAAGAALSDDALDDLTHHVAGVLGISIAP